MAPGQKGNMTIEELTAALEKAQASIAKLETKNSELIDREKKAKTAADEAEENREALERIANEKTGDVEKIKADLKRQHDRDIKKLTDQLTTKTAKLETLLIDNTINESITANNVDPKYARAVRYIIRDGAKMDENGEVTVNGVPFSDHIADFYGSSEAQGYVLAPVNTGGAAQGSSGRSMAFTREPKTPEEMDRFTALSYSNPSEAKAYAKSWGWPELNI